MVLWDPILKKILLNFLLASPVNSVWTQPKRRKHMKHHSFRNPNSQYLHVLTKCNNEKTKEIKIDVQKLKLGHVGAWSWR